MSDILYGVKLVMLKELDPATQDLKAGGIVCRVETAEEVDLEPVFSNGNENVLRTDSKILAIARTDDLVYGYSFKFKDNVFDISIVGLIEGGTLRKAGEVIVGYDSPMMAQGAKMLPFLAEIYVANYEGDSIVGYTKITLNNCRGKAPKLSYKNEFFSPEFEINAREATKSGKTIKAIDYVSSLPALDTVLPILTMTSIGAIVKPAPIIAKANKLGGLYCVNGAAVVDSIADLNSLVNVGLGAYASIVTANVDVSIATAALPVGSYKTYAVDKFNNISAPSVGNTLT